jgi:integrase
MRMETAMPLSDTALRALKPMERRYKKADQRGLYIEVEPNGSKLWRYKYRYEGVEKRIALGRYPDVSLSQARRKQEDARRMLEDGKDPSLERRRERLVASINAENTFGGIAREYIQHKMIGEQRAEVTVAKARWLLEQLNPLANMPVAEIRPAEVLGALRRIEAKGKYETARRCRSFASRVFRYAVATCRAEHDPSAVLRGALITPKVIHHSAVTDPKAIGELLRTIDEYPGSMITRIAMQIMPHVMSRPGELRQAEWREFDFDAAIWTIPPGRMKMRQPHAVPLSKQVLGYLDQLHALTGPSGFVFPAFHTFKRPMSENTINQAFRRMGYTTEEMTAHGWRTSASTLLNESGKWNPDAIERSLAHADPNAVRGTYNRGRYWAERVEMHQWWSDYLDQLRQGADILRPEFGRGSGPYSNLSQFKSGRAMAGDGIER